MSINASIIAGKGTAFLWREKFNNKLIGNTWWSNVIKDKYIGRANIVINKASILNNFANST